MWDGGRPPDAPTPWPIGCGRRVRIAVRRKYGYPRGMRPSRPQGRYGRSTDTRHPRFIRTTRPVGASGGRSTPNTQHPTPAYPADARCPARGARNGRAARPRRWRGWNPSFRWNGNAFPHRLLGWTHGLQNVYAVGMAVMTGCVGSLCAWSLGRMRPPRRATPEARVLCSQAGEEPCPLLRS